ncbi:AraC family transcriptional regulator [Paenibacillus agricola]|uniref:AraC family transcriptional regulator n=1 Tax=Paenibacillus agricola TaxID=2716264 RepID=A0ABX0J2V0_9BACL|nr:AraC family transcriptional regulator [Paenibacillus agricola]NHN30467.1 AraC family transcriptional regulator [Paenibacillus agricola]
MPYSDDFVLGRLPDVRIAFQLMGLHIRKVNANWTYPSHEHPMYEIHWVVAGEMEMVVDGKVYSQQQGDILFIRPGVTHSCTSAGSDGFTYFSVHFSVFDHAFSKELEHYETMYYPASSTLVKGIMPALLTLYNLAIANQSTKLTTSKSMKTHSAVFDLFGALIDQLSQSDNVLPTKKEILANRIAEQIEDSVRSILLHGPIQDNDRTWMQDIAKSLKMSTSQINRIFQQVYGKAPRKYLSEILLNEAKRLLLQTDLSIDHIAMMLGYQTSAHFSRQFKRWTKTTPSSYRQTIQA